MSPKLSATRLKREVREWSCRFVDTSQSFGTRRSSRCPRSASSTRRSTGGRSSSWFRSGRSPEAVAREFEPSAATSGTGVRHRPTSTKAAAATGPRPASAPWAASSVSPRAVAVHGSSDRLAARACCNDALRVQVRESWKARRRTCGKPRIRADLEAWGEPAAAQGDHHGAGRRRPPGARSWWTGTSTPPARPQGRGLVDGDASAHGTRRAGLGDGVRAPGAGGDPPLRPGHAVHILGLRSAVRAGRHAA